MPENAACSNPFSNLAGIEKLLPASKEDVPFDKQRYTVMISLTSTHVCVEFLSADHRPTGERFTMPHPVPDSRPHCFVVDGGTYDGDISIGVLSAGAPVTAYGISFDTEGTVVID